MQAALAKAPAGDIVRISNEALQLQEMGALFGNPSQTTSTIDPSTILAALYPSSSAPSTTSATTSAASTSSASLASYQNALQSEQVQTLFGTASATTSNSSFNLLG